MEFAVLPSSWAFLAAAVVVSACASGADTVSSTTALSTSNTSGNATEIVDGMAGPLEPGEYWIDHDRDPATGLRVDFTIADPGWEPIIGAFKGVGEDNYVAVLFASVTKVASSACHDTQWLAAGDTAEEIAGGLADIDGFATLDPLTEVTAFGYDGYHLSLEIPEGDYYEPGQGFTGCDDPNDPGGSSFDGWEGPTFSRYYQRPGQIVELWVLDVGGTSLLIESIHFADSPADDIARLSAVLDSIVITP